MSMSDRLTSYNRCQPTVAERDSDILGHEQIVLNTRVVLGHLTANPDLSSGRVCTVTDRCTGNSRRVPRLIAEHLPNGVPVPIVADLVDQRVVNRAASDTWRKASVRRSVRDGPKILTLGTRVPVRDVPALLVVRWVQCDFVREQGGLVLTCPELV